MEAPDPPIAVEPVQPATTSRPGPVFGIGVGAFRKGISGKYTGSPSISYPETFVVFSRSSPRQPHTTSFFPIPRRNFAASTMEAPDPPIAVESLQPATSSRPGPAYGIGVGGFRNGISGKYAVFSSTSFPETFIASSRSPPRQSRSTSSFSTTGRENLQDMVSTRINTISHTNEFDRALGRTAAGIMEALEPPATVVPLQPAFVSRPGPVCGCGDGVFQPSSAGEYEHCDVFSQADTVPNSSLSNTRNVTGEYHHNRPDNLRPYDHPSVRTMPLAQHSDIPTSQLTVYYQNVGGMRSKVKEFYLAATSSDYDVIVLTETWLRSDVFNSELADGYSIFRCDRSNATSQFNRGGGVLIAIKNCLSCVPVVLSNCEQLEQIAVRIKLPHQSIYVCTVYLRPNSEPYLYSLHSSAVNEIQDMANDNDTVLVLGDYNLPHLTWIFDEDINGFLPVNARSEQELSLTENLIANGLRQICALSNVNGRILDLAFINDTDNVEFIEPPTSILRVDRHHKPFVLRLDTRYVLTEPSMLQSDLQFDFNRCDYDALNHELGSIDWNIILHGLSTDEKVSVFYDTIHALLQQFAPHSRRSSLCIRKFPWWSPELRRQKNKLRKARKRYFRHRSEHNKRCVRRLEDEFKTNMNASYRDYLKNLQDDLKSDPNAFWKFVKNKKRSSAVPVDVTFQGRTSLTAEDAANLFGDFLSGVYSPPGHETSEVYLNNLATYNIHLPPLTITTNDTKVALGNVDPRKGPGPDGLPPSFLRQCADHLALPVSMIFNSSIAEGVFPEAWKIAAVTPIHKAGNKQSVENYRGISILCTLSKVLESLIHEKLYAAVRPMLSDYQHGFVKQRSTVTNLMSYVSSLNACLEKRQQVDAIYIDFSKAFDKVPHETALKKLDRLGLPTWIVNWLRSYLSNRTAYVKIGTHKSRPFAATSGVPQGSHLGPLIFILFVNDLCSLLHCDKLMYADDLKLFRIISSALDCAALQEDLRRLEDWCQLNGMNANAGKCKVISFSRSYTQLSYDYQLDSNVLERVTSIKDLGVIVDSKLGFAEHISATTAKSFAVLGFIQRTAADFDDIYTLKVLFFALVRSTLEYAVQVWAPHHVSQSVRIERVQKKFVRFALRRLPWNEPQQLPPYEDRCQLIELNTLSWRRTLLDRLFVFDILAGNIDCPDLLSRIHFNVPARSLRHQPSLWVPRHRTNYGQNNPLDRCCKNFNDVFSLYDPGVSKRVFKLRIFSV